jgi:hypothetical protein
MPVEYLMRRNDTKLHKSKSGKQTVKHTHKLRPQSCANAQDVHDQSAVSGVGRMDTDERGFCMFRIIKIHLWYDKKWII